MNIVYGENFVKELSNIWNFISKDSSAKATNFINEIKQKIENISHLPYMYRKSIYFDDENIRDLIYKGYVVVYKINEPKNEILVIGINKYKKTIEELNRKK